eukprot:gene19953-25921_t
MAGGQVPMVPYFPNRNNPNEYMWMDVYNVLGRSKRTLFVTRFLDDESCNQLIASLLWLQGQSDKEPITMYFNVPGSMIKPALAVYDILRRMTCPIITINIGLSVGMGAILCACGSPGQRYAYPNARFLISKTGLEDAVEGQSSDIALAVKEVLKDNFKIIQDFAILTKQSPVKLSNDMKRDFYLTAPEAVAYGVVDQVMTPSKPFKLRVFRGTDDNVVNFGHFSESRRVKSGPEDDFVYHKPGQNDEEFDDYVAKELENKKKSTRSSNMGSNRFANSRNRPPGWDKVDNNSNNNGDVTERNKEKFKNSGVIELTRTQGDVNVRIVFDVQDKEDVEPAYDDAEDDNEEEEEKEDEEFNEEDDETGVPFQVILEKNSNKVIVDAIAAQNYQIKNIQFVPGDKQIDDQKLYGGPVFDDLDEKLSDKFFDYLNEYGINDDISFYIVAKSAHKEQQEYEL